MSTPLTSIPVEKRKQLAATLGLFASLFVAVGAVAATGPGTAVVRSFVVIAIVVALVLALMAWGVLRSVLTDSADTTLDAAIEQAIAAAPQRFGQLCNCGHEHDPTELHITDAEPEPALASSAASIAQSVATCEHDGDAACAHDCDTCVLTSLRPSPTQTRSERLS